MSMVKADGIVKVERLCEGLEAGATVQVRLLRPLSKIKNTLVITGSHDMMIDVLADQMAVSSATWAACRESWPCAAKNAIWRPFICWMKQPVFIMRPMCGSIFPGKKWR